MATADRTYDRAVRRAHRTLIALGNDARDARMMAGLSQAEVGRAARMSGSKISRIEAGKLQTLSILDATCVADVVGLDLSARAYPGRKPSRDAAHGRRLHSVLSEGAPPLRTRREVLLPPRNGVPEQRSWDAMISSNEGDAAVDLELRLYDVQAQVRRLLLKWRDSGVDRLLLIVADTRRNRRVLMEFADYFVDLPRLRSSSVLQVLRGGHLPPTGLILI